MVALTAPGRTMPMPTAPAAWSPPPATTGVPAVSPVASAPSRETCPVTSGDSYDRGISDASMPISSSIVPDQTRFATSNSSVPDASATSVALSPVRRKRT